MNKMCYSLKLDRQCTALYLWERQLNPTLINIYSIPSMEYMKAI